MRRLLVLVLLLLLFLSGFPACTCLSNLATRIPVLDLPSTYSHICLTSDLPWQVQAQLEQAGVRLQAEASVRQQAESNRDKVTGERTKSGFPF